MPRRPAAKTADTTTVTVHVTPPHAVYWDGQQCGGILTDVDRDLAQHWVKHGWATVSETPPPPEK